MGLQRRSGRKEQSIPSSLGSADRRNAFANWNLTDNREGRSLFIHALPAGRSFCLESIQP